MKQRIFLLTLLFLLILTRTNDISAKETKLNEDMFTNVENTLKDKEIDLSYTQLVKQLIHGNVKGVLHTIKAKMKEVFLNRMLIQKDLIREILENAPEVGCATYRSRIYKISMVRMFTLASKLTKTANVRF